MALQNNTRLAFKFVHICLILKYVLIYNGSCDMIVLKMVYKLPMTVLSVEPW